MFQHGGCPAPFVFASVVWPPGFEVFLFMETGLWASWIGFFLSLLMVLSGVILLFLILIQGGKGGGLAGAFGGAAGQSAFGSRAADQITWITLGASAAWLFLVIATVILIPRIQGGGDSPLNPGGVLSSPLAPAEGGPVSPENPAP